MLHFWWRKKNIAIPSPNMSRFLWHEDPDPYLSLVIQIWENYMNPEKFPGFGSNPPASCSMTVRAPYQLSKTIRVHSRRERLSLKGQCHTIFNPYFFSKLIHLDPDWRSAIYSTLVLKPAWPVYTYIRILLLCWILSFISFVASSSVCCKIHSNKNILKLFPMLVRPWRVLVPPHVHKYFLSEN